MRIVEWRNSDLEPLPTGIWVLGKYHDYMRGYHEPSPVLRNPDGYYWVVTINSMDYSPDMTRHDVPPNIWRFI